MSLKLLNVPITALRPNPWNTNVVSAENEQKIEESLREFEEIGGFIKPIVVRETDAGYEILGGEHRWKAAVRLGFDEVPIANVGRIDDVMAKKIGLVDNAQYGDDDPLKLAELMQELGDITKLQAILPMSNDELAAIFSSKSIALSDLDALDAASDSTPELPSLSKAAPTHQIMRFKVPVEDVALVTTFIERLIREKGYRESDSLLNAGHALVDVINLAQGKEE